ncbi:MAG: DEAD/DEAH box helicase, partial [Pseudonocardiaceae bacterium]
MIRWPAAKTRGEQGIKAIVLYPMNALVSDRGRRIAEYLHDDARLHQVSAGVYIGGEGSHRTATRQHLVDSRRVLREEPPDILLTNYKMLDLLLRAEDTPLWAASATSLRYLVLDEFHTYDGAQGTDVAMLLRRLGATLRVAEPGRPLGRVTPVATSAALGGATRSAELRAFAATVFGTPFDSDSVSGRNGSTRPRWCPRSTSSSASPTSPRYSPRPLRTRPWRARGSRWRRRSWANPWPIRSTSAAAGPALPHPRHGRRVIRAARTLPEAVDAVTNSGVLQWGVSKQRAPHDVEQAVLRFLALLSVARVETEPGWTRPLLNIEVQLWIREVTRMLRIVAP